VKGKRASKSQERKRVIKVNAAIQRGVNHTRRGKEGTLRKGGRGVTIFVFLKKHTGEKQRQSLGERKNMMAPLAIVWEGRGQKNSD